MSVKLSPRTNASLPEGTRVYAVGDIHGRLDLLDELIDLIERDNEGRDRKRLKLIFLGDYVDRGPDSKGVVERLIKALPRGFDPIFLKGNHEDLLLSFLEDPARGRNWLSNGGDATLVSYGLSRVAVQNAFWLGAVGLNEAAAVFDDLLSDAHRGFYESLHLCYRFGDYFFVHGGVRPGVALNAQSERDMLWIRDEFLNWPHDFGAVIVHGHTPVRSPEDLHNRIGIDTYAFNSGKLTALGLEGPHRWFLST